MNKPTCKACQYSAQSTDESGKRIITRCILDQGKLPAEMAWQEGLQEYMAEDFAKDCAIFEARKDK